MAEAGLDLSSETRRMGEILRILSREYPEAQCSLNFKSPFELIVATILAAQCTDARVNLVTPALFKKFPTPQAMAKAKLPEIEKLIRSAGFYHAKARSISETSKAIMRDHGGKVPQEMEELTALRGVGRKTANVVRGEIFGLPGLVVDTHVKRLANRMGFTQLTDPVKIERDLMKIVPEQKWRSLGHLFIYLGRDICDARKPRCGDCPIARYCPKIGV